MRRYLVAAVALAALLAPVTHAQSLADFEKKVTEFTLANGMHFIVLERHQAPVVSFHAMVDAGASNDPAGRTGLAHMFEHMIGKGTASVGSKNWPEEKKDLAAIEEIYDRLDQERDKELHADPKLIEKLEAELKDKIAQANALVDQNAFPRVVEENGGVGFNASTGSDSTVYFYSLPSNRVELWFMLQSEWFWKPVYREFYKERDVVREERRMRIESDPVGRLQEMLLSTAFQTPGYRTLIGWGSDIENLRAKDAAEFHSIYYVPGNITMAIVGDVDPAAMKQLAERYFERIPAGPLPPRRNTVEPVQHGEKRVAVESPSQPWLFIGYKRPNQNDKDDPVFDVLAGILSSGRTGILYKEMVRDKKIALAVMAAEGIPGGKHTNLFLFAALPNSGKTTEENEQAIYDILDRLKKEKVDQETLQRVKTNIRAELIRSLDSNSGLAQMLASYYVNYGDWRKLFTGIQEIDQVSADDVQRVVRQYFPADARTVAYTVPPEKEGAGQ